MGEELHSDKGNQRSKIIEDVLLSKRDEDAQCDSTGQAPGPFLFRRLEYVWGYKQRPATSQKN